MSSTHRISVLTVWLGTGSVLAGATALACGDDDSSSFVAPSTSADASLDTSTPSPGEPGLDASDRDAGDVEADGGPTPPPEDPVVCSVTPCVTQITAGRGHFCALLQDKTVRCWGDNARGQLGVASAGDAGAGPAAVSELTTALQVSAVDSTSCALLEDGNVWCWGSNATAALGHSEGIADPHPRPSSVPLPAAARRVDVLSAAGTSTFACATLETGEPWCWGANGGASGLLGRSALSDAVQTATPGLADRLLPYGIERFGRSGAPFAIASDGVLIEWGFVSGRDAPPSGPARAYPIALDLPRVSDIAASASHACAIANGRLACWVHGTTPTFLCDGTGPTTTKRLPVAAGVDGTAQPRQVAVALGSNGACVRLSDGTVQCCGSNGSGGLGTGDMSMTSSMSFIATSALGGPVVQIAAADSAKCALLQSGEVKCWGANTKGELGQGTVDSAPHPEPLSVRFR